VEAQYRLERAGRIDRATAQLEARRALKGVAVGETGYLYAMTGRGELTAHPAMEGVNIAGERDERDRYFIREMGAAALASRPGAVLFSVYPWRNRPSATRSREKAVAYRYFREWDWIVAAGATSRRRTRTPSARILREAEGGPSPSGSGRPGTSTP
jgi:two-component system NtrC family sensor kinase